MHPRSSGISAILVFVATSFAFVAGYVVLGMLGANGSLDCQNQLLVTCPNLFGIAAILLLVVLPLSTLAITAVVLFRRPGGSPGREIGRSRRIGP